MLYHNLAKNLSKLQVNVLTVVVLSFFYKKSVGFYQLVVSFGQRIKTGAGGKKRLSTHFRFFSTAFAYQ